MLALTGLFKPRSAVVPRLSVEELTAVERAWFYQYKRDRLPTQSPAHVRAAMLSIFGSARTVELVALFETSAIPARPGEWRRRMH